MSKGNVRYSLTTTKEKFQTFLGFSPFINILNVITIILLVNLSGTVIVYLLKLEQCTFYIMKMSLFSCCYTLLTKHNNLTYIKLFQKIHKNKTNKMLDQLRNMSKVFKRF